MLIEQKKNPIQARGYSALIYSLPSFQNYVFNNF